MEASVKDGESDKPAEEKERDPNKLPPKTRIAMIVGYNGSDFCGSQKNPGVRTVEEEIEHALLAIRAISEYNFGDLKKIAWGRATRTDKSVHALQNVFSCKVHLSRKMKENFLEEFRENLNTALNARLPQKDEIKVFCCIEVSNRFNAKTNTSYREYSYYLPTFLLGSIKKFYVGKKGSGLQPEEQVMPKQEEITGVKVVNGITITKRLANEGDVHDVQEQYLSRDISHISSETVQKLYAYRISEEDKTKVHSLFSETFKGTKKYHNYTKDMRPDQAASSRFMMDLKADDFMYVNQDTFEITDANDPRALEFIHFYLKG